MTRKHFEAFAEAIREIHNEQDREKAALLVARVCSKENARFDFERFLNACEVK